MAMNINRNNYFITKLSTGGGTLARSVRAKKSTSTGMLTALAMTVILIAAEPAFAAKGPSGGGGGVVTPPPPPPPPIATSPLPADAIVFTNRDFVSISNLKPNEDLLVEVIRNNLPVAVANNPRTDANGFVEVNHPGGVCWDKTTPDIVANDLIKVSYKRDKTVATQTLTQDVKASQAEYGDTGKTFVVIKGTAQANGSPIDLSLLEIRIINREFIDPSRLFSRIGKRDIRADSAGGRIDGTDGKPISGTRGILAYDPYDAEKNPNRTNFTATFTGLSPTELQLVVEGQTRVMGWASTDGAGNRLGVTIYEVAEFGGPGMGNCPGGPGGVVEAKAPPENLVPYNPAQLVDAKNAPQEAIATVFPDRDFVSIDGFPAGTDLQVVVRRPSLSGKPVIGTARGIVGRSGIFEVNHPGGACWAGQTPDIAADDWIDIVKIVSNSAVSGQTQRVINTKITVPAGPQNSQVVVSGTALDETGATLPLDQIEQRIVNPDFRATGLKRRDIRATLAGVRVSGLTGLIAPYAAGCGPDCVWKATYTGLDPAAQTAALAGQSRSLAWLNTFNGNRSGITISEQSELGGPGMGNCPARGNFSIMMP
jgi:hypothetical protein